MSFSQIDSLRLYWAVELIHSLIHLFHSFIARHWPGTGKWQWMKPGTEPVVTELRGSDFQEDKTHISPVIPHMNAKWHLVFFWEWCRQEGKPPWGWVWVNEMGRKALPGRGNSTCKDSEQEGVGIVGSETVERGLGAVFKDWDVIPRAIGVQRAQICILKRSL